MYFSFFKIFLVITVLQMPFVAGAIQKLNPKKSKKYFDVAMENYRQYQFANAENFLLKSIEADSTNVNAYLLLSDVSTELKNNAQVIWTLEKVISIRPDSYTQAYRFLAKAYQRSGDLHSALSSWEKYNELSNGVDSLFVIENIQSIQNAMRLKNMARDIDVIHLDTTVNTAYNEYWPLVGTNDSTLYFTRLLTQEGAFATERLFFSEWAKNKWNNARQLVISENSGINEGTISMTADGGLIFFTACGRSDGYGSCDIYYMQKINGLWTHPRNAGKNVNSKLWEAQPSVSAYGDRLFFTSNRSGGMGENDIWECKITRSKSNQLAFSVPSNLGAGVNSSGNDFSPFIHADDQTLYFASDGKYGLGKHDLFVSRFDSVWGQAINLGVPLNSAAREDGLAISPSGRVAVFASDRSGAIGGSMDLYQFEIPSEIAPASVGYIKGKVFNKEDLGSIDAEIEIHNLDENRKASIYSEVESGYVTTLKSNCSYALNIARKGYLFYSKHINLKNNNEFNQAKEVNFYLTPIQTDARLVLNNIFFEVDSFALKKESYAELNTIVRFLELNPSVKIEISGHTDNSGSAEYNLRLSEKRAQAIADYLSQEINFNRIKVVGMGAKRPVKSNETQEGRRLNRRTEMRILDY